MTDAIDPFELKVPSAAIDDLHNRLKSARWPERETVDDWSQGAPLGKVRALVDYWLHQYDWRRCEAMLNGFGQFRTTIDGLGFHFLHVRSPHADAMPLLLTHGWPGSVLEFSKVVGPLTDPCRYGGKAEDAFHVVIPSLPGYGFSDKPTETGWGAYRIATALVTLMERLGYARWVAQGGDWGALITSLIGAQGPESCAGIHVNMPLFSAPTAEHPASAEELAVLAELEQFRIRESGYARQQGTKPQTIGYALVDSPVGQAAWIYEKYCVWSDCDGVPENVYSYDEMLDNIMLYWLPGNGASAGRLYWESLRDYNLPPVHLPMGGSYFPKDIVRPCRPAQERHYRNIIYWNELDVGGHFAAFEKPAIFVDELRACFGILR